MKVKMKQICSLTLLAAMTVSLVACADPSREGTVPSVSTSETDAITEAASGMTESHGSEEGKEETVYVIADAKGEPQRTIVSDWLKNPQEKRTITDRSDLANIQNVKGEESYTKSGDGNIVWKAGGNDIYYQGDSTQQLPLSVHVSYTLDGKKVTPEELAGASGHLKMTFTYENNTGEEREVNGRKTTMYQPFTVISCVILDEEKASAVEVTNGKLISSGEQVIAAGMAMPGLRESLGLTDLKDPDGQEIEIDIPETVTISADVTDFSLMTSVTLVDNSMLGDLDLGDVDSFDKLQDSMEKLTDSSTKLVDGSSELFDGTKELLDGVGEFSDGVKTLGAGAGTVASNMEELYSGLGSLGNGTKSLYDGMTTMQDQVKDLPSGVSALQSGAETLKKSLQNDVRGGAVSLQSGAETVSEKLREDIGGGADSIRSGAEQIAENAPKLAGAARQVKKGLAEIPDQVSGAEEALNSAAGYNAKAEALLNSLQGAENLTDEQKTAIANALKCLVGSDQYMAGVQEGMSGLGSGLESAGSALDQIAGGADAIAAGAKSGDTSNPGICEAADMLKSGAVKLAEDGSDVLASGAGDMASGIDTMISGNDGNNLDAVISGLRTLGKSGDKLVSGVDQLAEGAGTLRQGTKTAAAGAKKLTNGTDTLADAAGELKKGTDRLTDGVVQLVDGASELMDGMRKFDKEGIEELSELFHDDAADFIDRLRALQEYGKEYTTFSGKSNDMKGTVRFIIRTDSIGE